MHKKEPNRKFEEFEIELIAEDEVGGWREL